MAVGVQKKDDIRRENEELRRRLEKAETIINAIRRGRVDAFVVGDSTNDEVKMLEGFDQPYRLFVEGMQQGAVTLTDDGTIAFVNPSFANKLSEPAGALLGVNFASKVAPQSREIFKALLQRGKVDGSEGEVDLIRRDGTVFPAYVAMNPLSQNQGITGLILTDLSQQRQRRSENEYIQLEQAARSKAEEIAATLRASEERFQFATQHGRVGIWDWNLLTNEVEATQSLYSILGLNPQTPRSFDRESFLEFVHPDDREHVESAMRHSLEQDVPFELEMRAIRSDGLTIWLFTSARLVTEADRPVRMLGTTIDVTDLKRAEEETRQTREELQFITDTMTAAVVRCDANNRYTWVSREYAARFKLEPHDLVGQSIQQFLGEKAWQTIEPYAKRALSGERVDYEVPIDYDALGSRWIRAVYVPTYGNGPNPNGYVAVDTDLTSRKQLEDAVAHSEKRYRELVQGLPAAVYTCDSEGRIGLYNDAAVALWGRTPDLDDLWCASYKIFKDGVEISMDACPMADCVRNGRAVHGTEIIVEQPDGSRRHVLPHPEPLHDANGNIIGAINMLIDITDRKLAEEELAQTRDDLAVQVKTLTQLHELSIRLVDSPELTPTIQAIVETFVESCGARSGLLSLYNPDSGELYPAATSGFDPKSLEYLKPLKPALNAGCGGAAFVTRARAVVTDTESDSWFADSKDLARVAGFRAVHSTPILTRSGDVLGVLSVQYTEQHTPSQREMQMADLYARHAADTIEAAHNQQVLRESEQRFRILANSSPAMLWKTGPDGACTFLSGRWYEFTGQPVDSGLGMGWLEAVHREDRDAVRNVFTASHEMGNPWELDFRLRRADGEYRWVANSAQARLTAGGDFAGFVGLIIDITDRKEAEQDLVFLRSIGTPRHRAHRPTQDACRRIDTGRAARAKTPCAGPAR
ncbi:MAG: PAS domain S-box protein [Candidatus Hydrogenedentes bacterium]|nr:PAS domain S-box protein [Candidatus Hydrogenedentota bacterium]